MSSSLNRYIGDAMLKQHYYDGGDRTKTEENQNKKSEWERRLLGHKMVKEQKISWQRNQKDLGKQQKFHSSIKLWWPGFVNKNPKSCFPIWHCTKQG